MEKLAATLPKAELHLHIEGTFEPELIFSIAERNKIKVPFASVEALKAAYEFQDLQSFLDLYYAGMNVLKTEQDFHDLAAAYFEKAHVQNVVHAEIFFDPQAHTARGIPFDVVIEGLSKAAEESKQKYGITSKLIMCFLRDQSAQSAMETLDSALKYGDRIVAVGLDSAEVGNPPSKFKDVFDKARANGWLTVAHAGEEGPPEYVWEAIKLLKVSRIDHGIRSLEDPELTRHIVEEQMPLTVCPLSNVRLKVFSHLKQHNLKRMLELGVRATINSDDPAYFGGYVGDNFQAAQSALDLNQDELERLARNSFHASFLSDGERNTYLSMVDDAVKHWQNLRKHDLCQHE
ncbi:MAG: adenosine deaminase [Cyanobacteria bacterium PR.3.49]|jgi:adenosine deaminase|nr:adenosine deaminase [Cyanobacteria bacterium PR.3.49]